MVRIAAGTALALAGSQPCEYPAANTAFAQISVLAMIRSLVFTTQGRLHSKDIDMFLMPTLLNDTNLFLWVDLQQPTPEEAKHVLEQVFHFHPLSIEDCLAANSSPKVEEYAPREEDQFAPYLFLVMHAVDYNRTNGVFATSELNFFLGKNFLVTEHAVPLRSVEQVEALAVKETTRTARAPDRVAHLLLDALVDHYTPALDELSAEIAALEDKALQAPTRDTLNCILAIKKEVQHLRIIIGPQREILARFARGEFKLVRPHLVPYYRDVSDALVRIANLAQGYTDSLTGILQVYLNMSSNQTGEIVKVLTLITVITTPLMMIGTWYGMNFRDMPELSWRHAYPVAAGVMLLSTAGTYWYFKKKKWF
jgi:magnesium transporter